MRGAGRILVLGWGNPGRGDDGLGPACVAAIERIGLPGVQCEQDYQLQLEHAADVAEADLVLFVDAARHGPAPFFIEPVAPRARLGFTSHALDAEAVLAVAREAFGARAPAWRLGIRGEEFDGFRERLGDAARANLERAVAFVARALRAPHPAEALARAARDLESRRSPAGTKGRS